MLRTHHKCFEPRLASQIEVEKVDTAKFDDAYFKAAESKTKGSKKKTEDGFFNEVRLSVNVFQHGFRPTSVHYLHATRTGAPALLVCTGMSACHEPHRQGHRIARTEHLSRLCMRQRTVFTSPSHARTFTACKRLHPSLANCRRHNILSIFTHCGRRERRRRVCPRSTSRTRRLSTQRC